MTKSLHITISDYAYDRIFYGFNGNKSARSEELLLKGQDSEFGEKKDILVKLNEAEKKIKYLNEKTTKLERERSLLKSKLDKKNEYGEAEKMADAVLNRGLF